jgi:hypothetical protein
VGELKGKGVKFKGEIVDDEALKVVYFEDPDGNEMYLAEMKQQYANY